MMNNGLLVKKTTLLGCIIVLVWFTPHFLYYKIPSGRDILTLIRLFLNVFLIIESGAYKKLRHLETSLIIAYLIISVYGMLFVSSSLTFGKIVRFFEFASFIFAAIGLFGNDDELSTGILKGIQYMGGVYGILDLLVPSIKIGSGYGGVYFFTGAEAGSVQLLSMMMIVSAYLDLKEQGRIRIPTVVIGATEFVFAVQNESGQGRVMAVVFVGLLLLNKMMRNKVWSALNPIVVIVAVVFLNIATITLSFQDWPIAKFIIVDLLGKDMTLTGRDFIFTSCLEIFAGHPLLGYGYESSIVNDTLSKVFVAFDTAHNSFLQLLINDGIIGVALFIALVYIAMNYMHKSDAAILKPIYFGIIALMAGGIVSMVLTTSYFWLLLALALSEKSKGGEYFEVDSLNDLEV